jgi:hypothetical protein
MGRIESGRAVVDLLLCLQGNTLIHQGSTQPFDLRLSHSFRLCPHALALPARNGIARASLSRRVSGEWQARMPAIDEMHLASPSSIAAGRWGPNRRPVQTRPDREDYFAASALFDAAIAGCGALKRWRHHFGSRHCQSEPPIARKPLGSQSDPNMRCACGNRIVAKSNASFAGVLRMGI